MPRKSTVRLCSLLVPLAATLRIAPDEPAPDAFLSLARSLADGPPSVDRELVRRKIMEEVPVVFKDEEVGVALPLCKTNKTRKVSFERCAVVSNSRAVLRAKAGADVDGVDGPVFRVNDAVTAGFEEQVGKRKDVLIINDQVPCAWMTYKTGPSKGVTTVIINDFANVGGEGLHFLFPECMRYVLQIPNIRVLVLDYERFSDTLMKIIKEDVVFASSASLRRAGPAALTDLQRAFLEDPPWISSGMVAMVVALSTCEEVLHYGFTDLDDCRESYWDGSSAWSCHRDFVHNLAWEHLLMRILSNTTSVMGEGVVKGWPKRHRLPEENGQRKNKHRKKAKREAPIRRPEPEEDGGIGLTVL